MNLHWRHLNESQRALVAAKLAKLWTAQGLDSGANLGRKSVGRIGEKAAAQVNISPRLVTYATKVLQQGCPELIAAVASGSLKISVAAVFADLPRERQMEEVSRGPQRAAARARKVVAQAEAERIGSFGRIPQEGGEQKVRLLWVTAESLSLAIRTLQRRGFPYEL